jgi:hypothetical protein
MASQRIDPYTRVLELFDEWQTQHPQPTKQLLEQTTRLHNTTETGNQLAAILTTITQTERTRIKGEWQINISNQLLIKALQTLEQWKQQDHQP